MTSAGPATPEMHVRLALPRDVDAVAAVQARAWRASYPELLPAEVLDRLEPAARETWGRAVQQPPTDAHHLLVALSAGTVVGFAAVCPSEDADADPRAVGSLAALVVDPAGRGHGHGSRLLAAAAETMRTDGLQTATCWVPAADARLRAFLEAAGWAPDGAARELDTGGGPLRETRLHTRLS